MNISRLNISRKSRVTKKCKKCQVCYKSQEQKKEWKQSLVKETSVIGNWVNKVITRAILFSVIIRIMHALSIPLLK